MFLALLTLLEGPLGKLIMSGLGILVLVGTLTGVYFSWKHGVENQALIEFNQKQATQSKKDNDKFLAQQQDMQNKLAKITTQLNTKNQVLQKRSKNVKAYLSSPEASKGDRKASPVILETLRRLEQ